MGDYSIAEDQILTSTQKLTPSFKSTEQNLMKFSGINQNTTTDLTSNFQPWFVSENHDLASLQPPNDLGGQSILNEFYANCHFIMM